MSTTTTTKSPKKRENTAPPSTPTGGTKHQKTTRSANQPPLAFDFSAIQTQHQSSQTISLPLMGGTGSDTGRTAFAMQPFGLVKPPVTIATRPTSNELKRASDRASKLPSKRNPPRKLQKVALKQFSTKTSKKLAPVTVNAKNRTTFVQSHFTALEKDLPSLGLDTKEVAKLGPNDGFHTSGFAQVGHEEPDVKGASRKGQRAAQMLSHFSRLTSAASLDKHHNPVEIQFGYTLDKTGAVSLYASANTTQGAKLLQDHLNNPKALFESALHARKTREDEIAERKKAREDEETDSESEDEEATKKRKKSSRKNKQVIDNSLADQAERAASRLLAWNPTTGSSRRGRLVDEAKGDKGELADLWLADQLHTLFMNGKVTVVQNPEGRHAEQNIAHQMGKDLGSTTPASDVLADIQGTKWRCLACSSELGTGHRVQIAPSGTKEVVGRLWTAQGHPARTLDLILKAQQKEVLQLGTGQTLFPDSSDEESEESDNEE